jgi:hypothetical protein
MIVGALASNSLDIKRAGILLYGLQVASANARKLNHQPSLNYIVTETTLTPTGDEIAPDEDPEGEIVFQQFLQSLEEDDEHEADDDAIDANEDETEEHETAVEIAA